MLFCRPCVRLQPQREARCLVCGLHPISCPRSLSFSTAPRELPVPSFPFPSLRDRVARKVKARLRPDSGASPLPSGGLVGAGGVGEAGSTGYLFKDPNNSSYEGFSWFLVSIGICCDDGEAKFLFLFFISLFISSCAVGCFALAAGEYLSSDTKQR
ncbi:hypothetical protein GQ55_1G447000 [Panicum hallii var. hallii]|uniref:Uncharacterized protein n=1 Tax=Panicum hallii var. hallii TaxID=1504633 RepID=A0A2T7FE56_9POAL|nr:hypothetical protein GQ55_1G447000 [Panicum hallii var. hallii]